jgi:hypothetical protein
MSYDRIVVKGGETAMDRLRGIIGSPAQGSEFWDREREIEDIWRVLESGSVLLTAPRRFGKTSLMLHLVDHPREGRQAFYFDPEHIADPGDFIAVVMAQLLKTNTVRRLASGLTRILGNVLDRIDEVELGKLRISIREQVATDWQRVGQQFFELLQDIDQRTILIIDELPLMIDKIAKKQGNDSAQAFLSWLRSLRQHPESHDKVRWVTGGSIGIEKVLQRVGSSTRDINDLERIHVREFSEASAREFIRTRLHSEGVRRVPGKVLDTFLEVLEVPIPYFLQILVRESLNEMDRLGRRSPTEESVRTAYKEGLLASYNRTYFEHYFERLRLYYDDRELEDVAKALLSAVAERRALTRSELWNLFQDRLEGWGDEDTFSYLLSDLENDFYLVYDRDRTYRFATKVLRDWWLRYHSL